MTNLRITLFIQIEVVQQLPGTLLRSYKPQLKDVVEDYVESTYMIDTYYRKFYYFMDKIGMSENVSQ